jgi:hypothetical protein
MLNMEPLKKGRLYTVDLLIKIACFGKKKKYSIKAPDLNYLVQGGHLY